MKGNAYKEKHDMIMNENRITHLGEAVSSLLYKSIRP